MTKGIWRANLAGDAMIEKKGLLRLLRWSLRDRLAFCEIRWLFAVLRFARATCCCDSSSSGGAGETWDECPAHGR
ncbi:MAG TPA: hypothetical protein VNL38_02280, partial [Candidatus Nitrosotenuis sp.]|nr:hypothetical protein [Candidatus Nitrosotenuis sp.]